MCLKQRHWGAIAKQGGFLMPIALFIVIGLGALALAITGMSGQSNSAAIYEAVSVQALYAAESGAQYAAHQLLFDASDSNDVDTRCGVTDGETLNFTVAGLNHCSAELSCSVRAADAQRVYEIRSRGQCGGGSLTAQRVVQAAVTYD